MLYEYRCEECNVEFDVEHGLNEPGPGRCVTCSSNRVKRIISTAPRFVLKGSCWASDGYTKSSGTK